MKKRHVKIITAAFLGAALMMWDGSALRQSGASVPCSVEAKEKSAFEVGNYSKRYYYEGSEDYAATFVNIGKSKPGRVRFCTGYIGLNSSPVYETNIINKKIKDGKISFKWTDSWENSGSGVLKAGKNCVKLKMTVEKEGEINRASLDTGGKFITLKKRSDEVDL